MTPWLRLPYEMAARLATLGSAAPVGGDSKLTRALRGRRGVLERYRTWGATYRDPARPLVWLHAASVGEGLMALPVLQRVRTALPRAQLVYTYFSPSAAPFARRSPADFSDYLPFDTAGAADAALDALHPTVLGFVRGDVWPTLTERAARRHVALALLSAAVAPRSRRASPVGALATRDAYRALDLVGAVSVEDAERLARAGVPPQQIRITGDTRYDQAWARAHSAPQHRELVHALRAPRATVVAGSTWPSDDRVLLPAWKHVREAVPNARLIIAPHELHQKELHALERWAASIGARGARLGAPDASAADVIVVDRMGVLAELYALATVAYVGGGFHRAGLHSLVEPAVFGVPTIIGPERGSSRDARLMLTTGGVVAVEDADSMAAALIRLLTDSQERELRGAAMGDVVSAELGAADRSFQIVRELLGAVQEEPLHEVHAE